MHHIKREQSDMQAQNTIRYTRTIKNTCQNNMQSQTKTRLTFTTGKNHMENNMQVQMLPHAYSLET